MSKMINIPGRLHAVTSENVVAGSNEILDDTIGKKQNVINKEVDNKLASLETEVASKQKTLTAGVGITIAPDGTISTIADRSIGKIVEDHTAISSPVEGLLYLEQTEIQGTYAQYVYNGDTWVFLGNIVLSIDMNTLATKEELIIASSKEQLNLFTSNIFVNNGFVRPNGTISTSYGYKYSNKLDISKYSMLKLTIRVASSSVSPAVFYDTNEEYISGVTATTGILSVDTMYISIPSNAKYVVISGATSYYSSFASSGYYNINTYLDEFKANIDEQLYSKNELYALKYSEYRNEGFYRANGTYNNNNTSVNEVSNQVSTSSSVTPTNVEPQVITQTPTETVADNNQQTNNLC